MALKSMEERFLKSHYVDKGTDFSASSLTRPLYQLWVSYNHGADVKKAEQVGFKAAIGTAWHSFVEQENEVGIIKELSAIKKLDDVSIGGTADEVVWLDEEGQWQIRDHKTKGVYSAKKFLGIGTKTNPSPLPENQKEIEQLSIYRWLFSDMLPKISDTSIIYLWVMGHTKRDPMPEISEVQLQLIPVEVIEQKMKDKLSVATAKKEPSVDCDTSWLCDYCELTEKCPDYQRKHGVSFGIEA